MEEVDLVEDILVNKEMYYAGYPVLTDYEYDMLEEKLRKLCPDHPLLDMVGYDEELAGHIRKCYGLMQR